MLGGIENNTNLLFVELLDGHKKTLLLPIMLINKIVAAMNYEILLFNLLSDKLLNNVLNMDAMNTKSG